MYDIYKSKKVVALNWFLPSISRSTVPQRRNMYKSR